jgi:hypothetical protein
MKFTDLLLHLSQSIRLALSFSLFVKGIFDYCSSKIFLLISFHWCDDFSSTCMVYSGKGIVRELFLKFLGP